MFNSVIVLSSPKYRELVRFDVVYPATCKNICTHTHTCAHIHTHTHIARRYLGILVKPKYGNGKIPVSSKIQFYCVWQHF